MPALCPQTDEYFVLAWHDDYTLYGHLGRLREEELYFTSKRRGYTYFDDYNEGKKGYFAFDEAALWRVDSILPGAPLVFILKKINLYTMEDYKTGTSVSITGSGNVVATGDGNLIQVGEMNAARNIVHLKKQLEGLMVPAEDIEEITVIVQQEKPGSDGELPPKTQSWIKKIVDKVTGGASEIVIHTVGHLLAGAIRGYYHLPG